MNKLGNIFKIFCACNANSCEVRLLIQNAKDPLLFFLHFIMFYHNWSLRRFFPEIVQMAGKMMNAWNNQGLKNYVGGICNFG
jgi:hypothetical protein